MNPLFIAILLFVGSFLSPQHASARPYAFSNVSAVTASASSTPMLAKKTTRTAAGRVRAQAPVAVPAQTTTSAQPIAAQASPLDFASQIAADVLADTNAERVQMGLHPLTSNAVLASIAQAHSSDMLSHTYFAHTDLEGCAPSCRLTNAGYSWQAMGENIYEMSGYDLGAADSATQIVQAWMNSPEHRANILDASYTESGIGIAVQGSTVYATADYALPR